MKKMIITLTFLVLTSSLQMLWGHRGYSEAAGQPIYPNYYTKISNLLNSRQRVSIYVNISHIGNSCEMSESRLENWKMVSGHGV